MNELSKKGGICYEKSIEHLGSQRSFASPFAWTGISISSPIKAKTDVFARPFWKKKYALTARRLENFWQTLNGGELSLTIVVYIAANALCWITVKSAITRAS